MPDDLIGKYCEAVMAVCSQVIPMSVADKLFFMVSFHCAISVCETYFSCLNELCFVVNFLIHVDNVFLRKFNFCVVEK